MGKSKKARAREATERLDASLRERIRARQEERLWRQWRQSIDALSAPDDERWQFLRSAALATDLGTARPQTMHHAIPPRLARWLDRVIAQAGVAPATEEAAWLDDPACRQRLHDVVIHPARLRAARLRLALHHPDLSLVFEIKGVHGLMSESDIARALSAPGREGWTQPRVSERKYKAIHLIREWVLGPLTGEQAGSAADKEAG